MKALILLCTILLLITFSAIADTWIPRADYAGTGREAAVGFEINGRGYIGTGSADFEGLSKTFWQYDPDSDVWTQKADFGGVGRKLAAGFSIGSKGYIGTGWISSTELTNDFWEYDSDLNSWTQKATFPGGKLIGLAAFSIAGKGYMGLGGTFSYPKKLSGNMIRPLMCGHKWPTMAAEIAISPLPLQSEIKATLQLEKR